MIAYNRSCGLLGLSTLMIVHGCASTRPSLPHVAFLDSEAFKGFGQEVVAHVAAEGRHALVGEKKRALDWHALVVQEKGVEGSGLRFYLFAPRSKNTGYQEICHTQLHMDARLQFVHAFSEESNKPESPTQDAAKPGFSAEGSAIEHLSSTHVPSFGWSVDSSTPDRKQAHFELLSMPDPVGGVCVTALSYDVSGPTDLDSALPKEAWGWIRQLDAGVEVVQAERVINLAGATGQVRFPTQYHRRYIALKNVAETRQQRLHVSEEWLPLFYTQPFHAAWAFDGGTSPSSHGAVEPWPKNTTIVWRPGARAELKLLPAPSVQKAAIPVTLPKVVALEWLLGCNAGADSLEVQRPSMGTDEATVHQRFNRPPTLGGFAAAIGQVNSKAGPRRTFWLLREPLAGRTLMLRDIREPGTDTASTEGLCIKDVRAWLWSDIRIHTLEGS